MADDRRRVAIVIGVGDAKPLKFLASAINSAREFSTWAVALGYESKLITDGNDNPVTVARLRAEVEAALNSGSRPIHRLVIFFAGHGLIREAGEGLWLLSDWRNELRAVAAEPFRRRLYMYGIKQIAIFADACRKLPPDITAADLTADAVLGQGPHRASVEPEVDKFTAAQDGYASYSVPGKIPEEDRCLFSGVLLEGLWGQKQAAFSSLKPNKVTSASLGAFLKSEVPKVAGTYGRKLNPSVSPTFPNDDDIYFGDGVRPHPPRLPPWPPPDTVVNDTPIYPDSQLSRSWPSHRMTDLATIALQARDLPELYVEIRNQSRPMQLETGSGLVAAGGKIRKLWTESDIEAHIHGAQNWWRIGEHRESVLKRPTPLMIEYEDGLFGAFASLPGFIASVHRGRRGVSAIVYRPVNSAPRSGTLAEEAIAALESGPLRYDDAANAAVGLREFKHVDPVFGVVSAYLYESIGDIDSVRRMAYYYVEHDQPIPFDIALLAQLQCERQGQLIRAHVPVVKEREPRTDAERQNQWTYVSTPEATGIVGGLWPWLRQGWAFLEYSNDDESNLVVPGLAEFSQHLCSSRFTTLEAKDGHRLAELFRLAPAQ